ncbi:hypothetical protein FA95DRAFT_1551717 [Auriscalpium vulgare]|uniref:Uncharacterized protein n=1 Tax=Auriscalpium vulgare TaxID=40419 RepID=A0ACB8SDF6_9AGAM|nr:hypothetical protein FA95DRAFT_1551717 [Auriscalpium vulgare]
MAPPTAATKAMAISQPQFSTSPNPNDLPSGPKSRPSKDTARNRSRKRIARPNSSSSSEISPVDAKAATPAATAKTSPIPSSSAAANSRTGEVKGPLVWVCLGKGGQVIAEGDEEDVFWWPGGVLQGDIDRGPVSIRIFGHIPFGAVTDFRIVVPSVSVVLPMKKRGRETLQFSASTFRTQKFNSTPGSPLKRPRTQLDEAFRAAVDLMLEADARLNDGLPSSISSYKTRSIRRSKPAAMKLPEPASPVSKSDSPETWLPPPCDPFVDVPGEPVLALARKISTEYWPARVEAYIPPRKPSGVARYRVRFLDDTTATIPRDMFFTADEPAFGTCRLGQFTTNESDGEVDSDGDDDGLDEYSDAPPQEPPPTPEEFCDLSVQEQFAYIKPVLRAILDGAYKPASDRHNAFMRGGTSRQRLRKSATGKGSLSPRDAVRLGAIVQQWAIGNRGPVDNAFSSEFGVEWSPVPKADHSSASSLSGLSRSTSIHTDVTDVDLSPPSIADFSFLSFPEKIEEHIETPVDDVTQTKASVEHSQSQPQPQPGCADYEALPRIDKIQYCFLVLLHEATIQLLLWRGGQRRSLELLQPVEEQRLHDLGLAKTAEIDFVDQVHRLRRMKARGTQPARKAPVPAPPMDATLARSRTRRARP